MLKTALVITVCLAILAGICSLGGLEARDEMNYCCQYGNECTNPSFPQCCNPEKLGALPCAESPKVGYCRASCTSSGNQPN